MKHKIAELHRDERGIAIIVVMSVLVVLGLISAGVLATSLASKQLSAGDRSKKLAYAAAVTGLRAGTYRLNAYAPADNGCPPLPDASPAPVSNGICGPYGSDTSTPGTTAATAQPLVRERYKYWISWVMQTTSNSSGVTQDICTGTPPLQVGGFPIQERCITAVGEALNASNTATQSTSRVQARVAAGVPFFPIPGLWGTNCLTINPNNIRNGTLDCQQQATGGGSSVYKGALGSNVAVIGSLSDWGEDPGLSSSTSPAQMYLGNTAPGSSTHASYTLNLNGGAPGTTPAPNDPFTGVTCGGGGGTVTYHYPCLPYGPGYTSTSNNVPKLFNTFFQLPRMEQLFRNPPKVLRGAGTPGVGCTPADPPIATPGCDTATFNNDSFLSTTPLSGGATYTGTGCTGSPYSNLTAAPRQLSVAQGCTLRLPNGTYNFCSLTIAQDAKVLPADTSAQGEVRVFIDNPNRLTAPTPYEAPAANPCKTGQTNVGKFVMEGSGGHSAAWMTTSVLADCSDLTGTAALADPVTQTGLAGEIYIYGAGDSPEGAAPIGYKSHAIDLPTGSGPAHFFGLMQAPNSTLNLPVNNSCIKGGIAAGGMNVAANLSFRWDQTANQLTGSEDRTFYRNGWSNCKAAFDPALPMDGC
jgi:Tfp pilus assembly protein PilX